MIVTTRQCRVAIVDFGLGNLFSVKHACEHVGIQAVITADKQTIWNADAVLLPGVGAFRDAMNALGKLDLITVLQDVAASSKPLFGVCLGIQLLMTESFEFGIQKGLGIIDGQVVPLDNPKEGDRKLKVPEICWNRIYRRKQWKDTLLDGIADGEYMYFVHSYVVEPQDSNTIISTTQYGQIEFCSSLQQGSVFACQFHPERSGVQGLRIYQNLKNYLERRS
jgi:imidazole glycerol-phosphate synthase subunit HisH